MMTYESDYPIITTQCADCGLGTLVADEWYMIRDEIWEAAWAGRRKSWHAVEGQQILCRLRLEKRIGRTLTANDFTDTLVNSLNKITCQIGCLIA
jgi:hypothetical protein